MCMGQENLLTVKEVCEKLRVTKAFFYVNQRGENRIPTMKLGKGSVRISEKDLNEWLEKQRE